MTGSIPSWHICLYSPIFILVPIMEQEKPLDGGLLAWSTVIGGWIHQLVCSLLYFLPPITASSLVCNLLYYFSPTVSSSLYCLPPITSSSIFSSLLHLFSPIVCSTLYFLSPILCLIFYYFFSNFSWFFSNF